MDIVRIFSPSDRACNNGCVYCFANRPNYIKPQLIGFPFAGKINALYPQCDGEIVFDQNLLELYKTISNLPNTYLIFSYSTKNNISSKIIKSFSLLNDIMILEGKGFVKISISISSKYRQAELEPYASSYKQRIETLKKLYDSNIETSVIFKPILPFIDKSEYLSVLEDISPFADKVTIGGLYVDSSSSFFDSYLDNYSLQSRTVSWLSEKPIWPYIDSKDTQFALKARANEMHIRVFDSDVLLLKQIWRERLRTSNKLAG